MVGMNDWRWLIAALAALCVGSCNVGCKSHATDVDTHIQELRGYAEVAAQWNLDFEMNGTFGDGHVAGAAFNVSGLHGYFKLSGKPTKGQ